MRKVLSLIIAVFVAVCVCGVSYSVAGDLEEGGVIGPEALGPAPTAIADNNYIRDVWVSSSSSSDSAAVRVYSSGSSVYCHVNYYVAAEGTNTRYYMVGNAGGTMSYFYAAQSVETTGEKHKYVTVSGLADGVYFFTIAMTMTDNNVISPTPYWFIIE